MLISRLYKYKDKHPFYNEYIKKIFSNKYLLRNELYIKFILKKVKLIDILASNKPMDVSIETSLSCNSKCIMCAHHTQRLCGIMDMDLFKKIIDDCRENNINYVDISGYGEPLIDPYLFERIEYIRQHDMSYWLTTNAILLDDAKIKKILEFGGLTKIDFSANAYDPDIYQKIMPGHDRDKTYRNIHKFLEYKKNLKLSNIHVGITTVKIDANRGDIKKFVSYWRKQPGVDQIMLHDLLTRTGKVATQKIGSLECFNQPDNPLLPCSSPWDRMVIFYDGKVGVCLCDLDKRNMIIGDITRSNLRQINRSKALLDLRKVHLDNSRQNHPQCSQCKHNSHWFFNTKKYLENSRR